MAVKKCCIENCNSCSTREEDNGVTYHKFPKDITLHDTWMSITHNKNINTDSATYVCSRHFCKSDFQTYKDSKYVLKSDAIPSIFSWNISEREITKMDVDTSVENTEEDNKYSSSDSKESEGENVDAIKRFIEDQDKEIEEKVVLAEYVDEKSNDDVDAVIGGQEQPLAVATSVMDMILCESEANIANKGVKPIAKPTLSAEGGKGNNSMALSVGSKVEAKDFCEMWYPAEITEVDYDEMEVLVHYETDLKRHDEWINVSSPRLRPIGSGPAKIELPEEITIEPLPVKEEIQEAKFEDIKSKLDFNVGERCLARWRDNRRFVATINKKLENGSFEIIFDDGFHWTCNVSRLSKLKEKFNESLTIDTSSKSPTYSTPSPVYGAGPSNAPSPTNIPLTPAYHTHLFDPARDYLGSKSERREMKRKLNIKEIFNIGQKRPKMLKPKDGKPLVRKPQVKKELKDTITKKEIKVEIPDAVASIIGSIDKRDFVEIELPSVKEEKIYTEENMQQDEKEEVNIEIDTENDEVISNYADSSESYDCRADEDPVLEEEVKLEKFDKEDDVKHEEVIDRIRDAINKLEDGLNKVVREKLNSPKPEIKAEEPIEAEVKVPSETAAINDNDKDKSGDVKITVKKIKKGTSKVKKGKKLRLLQEKKVKIQVEKVKTELEEMKKQVAEMRQQMKMKTGDMPKVSQNDKIPESFLLPGEWCAKWLNGQPVGTVSEIECEVKHDGQSKPALPRRSVHVEDKRLPEGWTKHMVRRSLGHSAGKWDVVIVSPDNRRFHTKNEMRNYLENNHAVAEELAPYHYAIMDFGVHLKLSRRMGWITYTPGGVPVAPESPLPAGTMSSTSPLVKRKKLTLKKKEKKVKEKKRKLVIKLKLPRISETVEKTEVPPPPEPPLDQSTLEDGYVFVGSLKVQIIDNLLRCPAESCLKNFRNNTLLQMHIKHYHRELRKMMGVTPKVLDLAYARTMPVNTEERRPQSDSKVVKVKIPRPKREEPKIEPKEICPDIQVDVTPTTPVKDKDNIPKALDSPKLRHALVNKPVKRPRVLLPVRRPEPEQIPTELNEDVFEDSELEVAVDSPIIEPLDFEMAISTHTVTRPMLEKRRKGEKKMSFAAVLKKGFSEDEEWFGVNSDLDTRSSFPRSGTPDSKILDGKAHSVSTETTEDQKDLSNMYMFTENGERIKIVHMKREEIINCHCGYREEDGLMVQCELCLCWQHALCHNIQRESEVPEKYTCSICLNPRRGRRSKRFLHDQDRMYEGLLAGAAAKPCESLRRSHELSGNLIRIEDALHALRVQYYVATKKDHPKLYLWAQDWEAGELTYAQEKLNSDYSDLNIMINTIGKENLPIKPQDMKDLQLNMNSPLDDHDGDRFIQREGAQTLLSSLLSSPGGGSLELPISTSELERLAKSVQERECSRVTAPQPEAAIENSACRERLLRHISRCHARLDARLDSIEAQVAELESQDPSLEDDETADYFPRTKQTIQMLMRDLDTMEELGVIT